MWPGAEAATGICAREHEAGIGIGEVPPVLVPAALLIPRVFRICSNCDREIESGDGLPKVCMGCLDRGHFFRISHRRRKAAERMAIATPAWTIGGLNHQARIYAEFSMPHRFPQHYDE